MRFSAIRPARFSFKNIFKRKSAAGEESSASGRKSQLLGELSTSDEDQTKKAAKFAESELDLIRARGFLKHIKPYNPPENLEHELSRIVSENLSATNNDILNDETKSNNDIVAQHSWKRTDLSKDLDAKFKILTKAESVLGKRVPNSYLHEMKTANDLLEFFKIPAKTVAPYNEMARTGGAGALPTNLHIIEECVRYDPARDGPTAFPKHEQKISNLRYKRMYKCHKTPTEWHEFSKKIIRHDTAPEDAPWRPENSVRRDVITRRRPDWSA